MGEDGEEVFVEGLGDFAIDLLISINSLQTEEEFLNAKREEKIAELGVKIPFASDTYVLECYNNYSKAFDDIALSINSATNIDELNDIKVKVLLSSAEALLSTTSNDGEDKPMETDVTPSETGDSSTDTSDSTDDIFTDTSIPHANKGCKSSVISGFAIILTVAIIGVAVVKFKRKEV